MNTPESTLHILLVDDDEDTCEMVTTMFAYSGIEVTTAGTIKDGWQLAQAEHFDLYLLDSRLPDGSGLELCRSLRTYMPHTPIVFYSANAFVSDIEKGLLAGANAYLTKPYMDDLAQTIFQTIKLAGKHFAQSHDNSLINSQNINY